MKYSIVVLLLILSLVACDKPKKEKSNGTDPVTKQSEPLKLEKQEPKPQTITLQEVSRIALVEAKQFLTNAKSKQLDFSAIMPVYDKAQLAYDEGDYKLAQKQAVKVRQLLEQLQTKK